MNTAVCWHCSQLLELPQFLIFWQTENLSQSKGGGGFTEGYGVHTLPKTFKMALITDYLPADAYADAPPRINIGQCP